MPIIGTIASSTRQGLVTGSYDSIATINVTSNTSTVSFTNIPSTYKHLQVRMSIRTGRNSENGWATIELNNTFGLQNHALYGNGSGVIGYSGDVGTGAGFQIACPGATINANYFGVAVLDILDYASTSKRKTIRILSGASTNGTGGQAAMLSSYLWGDTAAVTSIRFGGVDGGAVVAGSTLALYGMKGA